MEKRELIRKEILYYIEKNSRANLGELAVLLGNIRRPQKGPQ